MPVDAPTLQKIKQGLQAAQRVLVVAHIRPDGDAIGSLLGLGLALQAIGKEVQLVSEDGVPANFRHLEGNDQVKRVPQGQFGFICVVDCSDMGRTGKALEGYPQPDLNIDHHLTNLNFARFNLVDYHAVATAEIIAGILPGLGLPLSQPVAEALLTGLITDTIGFRTSNMRPQALRLAAELMEVGADLPELYRQGLVSRSFPALRLWGAGLSKLERRDGLVWTTLTLTDDLTAGYTGHDDADLVNSMILIEDAEIAIIFIEQPGGRIKVSWRAQPGIDVSQIALQFGGGGHPAASGAELRGSLQDVQEQIVGQTLLLLPTDGRKLRGEAASKLSANDLNGWLVDAQHHEFQGKRENGQG